MLVRLRQAGIDKERLSRKSCACSDTDFHHLLGRKIGSYPLSHRDCKDKWNVVYNAVGIQKTLNQFNFFCFSNGISITKGEDS